MPSSIELKAHKDGLKYHLKFEYDRVNIDQSVFIYKPIEKKPLGGLAGVGSRNIRGRKSKGKNSKRQSEFNARPSRVVTSIGDPQGIIDKFGARRIYLNKIKRISVPVVEEKGNWLQIETTEGKCKSQSHEADKGNESNHDKNETI